MTSAIPLTAQLVSGLRQHPLVAPHEAADFHWSENLGPPVSPRMLAGEAIWVICNSGMKNTVARQIFDRVIAAVQGGSSASTVFGHQGKSAAIDLIWRARGELFADFLALTNDDDRLTWCEALPWIGKITKYHLAKNLGVDCAKPDVHLQRLADLHGETVDALCQRLARDLGWRVATVDLILWRACATGAMNSRTGAITPGEARK